MHLILATNNQNKVKEMSEIIKNPEIKLSSLKDLNLYSDPEETGTNFLENSMLKAQSALKAALDAGLSDFVIMSDDSGLCVDALNGQPGVYSARYASDLTDNVTWDANNRKLLKNLEEVEDGDRTAHFETCAVLIWPDGSTKSYTGIMSGKISFEPKGNNGFGYDPVFIPDCLENDIANKEKLTIAELGQETKNKISHRSRAVRGVLSSFLS